MKEATLCFVRRGDPPNEVLLGLKQHGFGQGKYGGFGGKIEPGESPATAAARELAEEVGLIAPAQEMDPVAYLVFHFPHRPEWNQAVHAFLVRRWQGEPFASAEMVPAWFQLTAIPFQAMWHDSVFWLPPILAGQRLTAHFTFDADNETVAKAEIEPWNRGQLAMIGQDPAAVSRQK